MPEVRDAQLLANGLDEYVASGLAAARQVFSANEDLITRFTTPFTPRFQGSWNKPVLAWCTWLIATADERPARLLVEYAKGQLGRDGLWGREILSWLYWWPLPAVGLVHNWLRDPKSNAGQLDADLASELEAQLARLLRAHALTLSLFALPGKNPNAPDCPVVWCPGIRTLPGGAGNLGLSYFFATVLGPHRRIPVSAVTPRHWGWPYRVTWALSHEYLGAQERRLLREHRDYGTWAAAIAERLNELGARLQAPVTVWRYRSGDACATISRNTHGTKPPAVGVSRVGGNFHLLRGVEGKRRGARRRGEEIRYRGDRRIPAPPPGGLLYAVTIGPRGARLVAS
jgi:hypothetical protein